MNDKEYRIVRVTNISDFEFTGEAGARFAGKNFPILAGKSLLVPLYIGEHLATHLARQILIRKAPIRDASQTDGKGPDRPLWDDSAIADLIKQIMVEVYEESRPIPKTEADAMVERVKNLNDTVDSMDEENISAPKGGNAPFNGEPTDTVASDVVYKDKGEVIAELDKRGIKYDPRSSKTMLESFLK